MQKIKIMLVALAMAMLPTAANADFNADRLVTSTMSLNCLDYCVTGVGLFLKVSWSGVSTRFTPQVSYRQPDALVMVHRKPGDSAWAQWRNSFGKVLAKVEKPLVATMIDVDAGGGKAVSPHIGYTANTFFFKNVDVVGHPMSFMFNLLSSGKNKGFQYAPPRAHFGSNPQGGSKTNLGKKTAESVPSPQAVNSEIAKHPATRRASLKQQAQNAYRKIRNAPKAVVQTFKGGEQKLAAGKQQLEDSQQKIDNAKSLLKDFGNVDFVNDARFQKVMDAKKIMQDVGKSFGGGEMAKFTKIASTVAGSVSGGTGGNVFCPSQVAPLNPYFISGLDFINWRFGFFERFQLRAWNPLGPVIGSSSNKWGELYPRHGSIYALDEAKASAVLAERAMHITTRKNQKHVYALLPGGAFVHNHSGWQMISPKTTNSCRAFATSHSFPFTRAELNHQGRYAYSYWRRYECYLQPKKANETLLAKIDIKLCINDL